MRGWKIKIGDTTYHIAYRVYDERKGSIEGVVRRTIEIYALLDFQLNNYVEGYWSKPEPLITMDFQGDEGGTYYAVDTEIEIGDYVGNFSYDKIELVAKILRKIRDISYDIEDPCLFRRTLTALRLLKALEIVEKYKTSAEGKLETIYVIQ